MKQFTEEELNDLATDLNCGASNLLSGHSWVHVKEFVQRVLNEQDINALYGLLEMAHQTEYWQSSRE